MWSGLAMASITSSASSRQRGSRTSKYSQSFWDINQKSQDATLTPSWLPETG